MVQVSASGTEVHQTNSTAGVELLAATAAAGTGSFRHKAREHHAGGSGQVSLSLN